MSNSSEPRDSASPSPPADGATQRQHKHIGAVIRRIGNAIRRRSPEPSASGSDPSRTSPTRTDNAFPAHLQEDAIKSTSSSLREPSIRSGASSFESHTSRATNMSVVSQVSRQSHRDERARVVHARYGLTMDPNFSPQKAYDSVARVQKNPRLRMHATCHLCNTAFRTSNLCPQCQHRRCRMCPRALPKGVQALIDQTKQQLESIPEPPRDDLALLRIACGRDSAESCAMAIDEAAVADPTVAHPSFTQASIHPTHRHVPHTLYTRECCATIEQAIASICPIVSPLFPSPGSLGTEGSTRTGFQIAKGENPTPLLNVWQVDAIPTRSV
ncbi:hypothetical protein K461DRAFT_268366 [Myriangium duriaei CBS 260.36]|uniref:Uncharacterized protein n=1 Tax=Myriangium duriaei CBS 260.36 TaxID=1168546 RepID=A0A9P4MGS3_9PEZI|nr:hypothetical protein K461DRAFT_268366 [Myriangium duriaei CBS 260.36]